MNKNLAPFIKRLFLIAIACLSSIAIHAHDFEVDGIFYNFIEGSDNEVAVTYEGDFSGSNNEYSGAVVIPGTVTYIGTTYSVTSIGNEAFYDCEGLTSITIPESVTSIGEGAFWGCIGLSSITIPNTVTAIGNCAFIYCSGISSVTIPGSVTSIGNYVFSGCGSLTSVMVDPANTVYDSRGNSNAIIETSSNKLIVGCKNSNIPTSVTSIGEGAFYVCSGLTGVTIPSMVASIGYCAFSGCSSLTSIVVDPANNVYDSRDNSNAIIETSTGKLIAGCKNTKIPNTVTSIGADAFYKCYSLTSIKIPESVISIGKSAFEYCYALTGIEIPNKVTSIGDFAFYECRGLTSIKIPDSVTSIGNYAFYECRGLTSIEISESLTSIGNYAFYECRGLTSISIPNSVTSIGDYAFCGCGGLTSTTIGSSVASIGIAAFHGCAGLAEIRSLAIDPPVCGESVFKYVDKNTCKLYVPYGCVEAYTAAERWKDFINTEEIEEIEPNRLAAADIEVRPGKTFTFPVELINEGAISGFQCDIYLPEGIAAELYEEEYDVVLTQRATKSHMVSSALQDDGAIRVVVMSNESKPFADNSGSIFEIKLSASKDLQEDTQIAIKNILLATPELTQFEPKDVTANVILKKYILGDVNDDEIVNITDAVGVVNTILGNEPASFVFDAADVVADGTINITDAIGVVNIILNGQPTPTALAQQPIKATLSATSAGNKFYIEDFSIEAGESKEIAILLTNDVTFSGFQADIYLPEGLSIYQEDDEYIFDLSSRATRSHSISSALQADGAYRIACFSSSSKDIKENEGELVYFTVIADDDFSGTHTITVKNTIFTQSNLTQYNLDETTAAVTGPNLQSIGDIITDKDSKGPVEHYNLHGIRVEDPQNGIYIRRQGKKAAKVILK